MIHEKQNPTSLSREAGFQILDICPPLFDQLMSFAFAFLNLTLDPNGAVNFYIRLGS